MKKVGGLIAAAFTVKEVVDFSKTAVNAASEIQSAWTGLYSIANGTGKSFGEAQKFINDYTKDGLVSITEAATAYKNLLSRGYDTTQIEGTMNALKDSASFGRQASYDLGEAVVTATEGLKNENSILVDNAGVTKNVAKMWDEYAKSIGKTSNNLSQTEKIQAEYNGIMQETRFQTGDAVTYANTFSGQMQRLNASFTQLKVAVGKVITPITQLFIPVINAGVTALTNFFNSTAQVLKLFGLEFKEVMSKSSSPVTNLTNDISNTGDQAVKTAKKINKAFANVDEINVLSNSKNNDSNPGGGSSNTQMTQNFDVSDSIGKTTNAFSKLFDKFKELSDLFKKGFKISFGNTDFKPILKSIDNIKKSLKNIFTDPGVKSSASNFVDTLVFNLGKVTGSIGRIGINIATGLVGSIEKYLNSNTDRIKKFIITMFDVSSKDLNLTGNLWQALGEISDVLKGPTAQQIGANIIAMFTIPLMSVIEFISKFAVDLRAVFVQPIIDNVDKIKLAFENTLAPIQTVTGVIAEAFTYVGDKLNEIYDNSIGPLLDSIKTGISDTFGKLLDVYNEYIAPFFESCANSIQDIWDNHLKALMDNIAIFVSNVVDGIKFVWEFWLKPLIDWIIQNVIPVVVPILKQIKDAISTVIKIIIDIINSLMGVLNGIITFIKGVFTGNWKMAWDGIKKIFGSIWDGIKKIVKNVVGYIKDSVENAFNAIKNVITSVMETIEGVISRVWNGIWSVIKGVINMILGGIEGMVNGVIKGINLMVGALNKLSFDVPDWVPGLGGKKFGFNLKTINEVSLPRLYQGGYIEKNNPQLAIVGDNTREGEIVSPESKIYEQVMKANKDSKNNDTKEMRFIIEVRYEDGKKIIKKINQAEIDAGEILLLV